MGAVFVDITMSLDGFITGPGPGPEHPLGKGGERLHEWGYELASFRERHGRRGGAGGPDEEVMAESLDRLAGAGLALEKTRVIDSPKVTHLGYRV